MWKAKKYAFSNLTSVLKVANPANIDLGYPNSEREINGFFPYFTEHLHKKVHPPIKKILGLCKHEIIFPIKIPVV